MIRTKYRLDIDCGVVISNGIYEDYDIVFKMNFYTILVSLQ